MIHFNCRCGKSYSVNDNMAGRTAPCQQCGNEITVPSPSPWETVPVPPPTPKQLYCTNCGNSVSEQAVACMSCGAKPIGHRKFCHQCGVGLNPEQIVCVKCGAALRTAYAEQIIGEGMNWLSKGMKRLREGMNRLSFGEKNEGMNRLSEGINRLSCGIKSSGITIGEAMIYFAAILALISFFRPWVVIVIHDSFWGEVTILQNGFFSCGFLLGILFIYPVWMALTKKNTTLYKVSETACAAITLIFGTTLPFVVPIRLLNQYYLLGDFSLFSIDEPAKLEKLNDIRNAVGTGAYLFICACIVLIVGIILRRLSSRHIETNDKPRNINTAALQNTVARISDKAKGLPKPVLIAGITIIVLAVFVVFGRGSSALVGKWVEPVVEWDNKSRVQLPRMMEFLKNGTVILDDNRTKPAAWKLENNRILVIEPGTLDDVIQLDYKIVGSTLTLTREDGKGATYIKLNPKAVLQEARKGRKAFLLFDAVRKNDIKLVKSLVSKGADARSPGLLYEAVQRNNIEIVKFLVSNGADVSVEHIKADNIEIVKLLVSKGADVNVLLSRAGNIEVAKFLVSEGANVNAKFDGGQTLLHTRGDTGIIKFLVAQGADVNAKDDEGKTPLHNLRNKRGEAIKFLVTQGANVNAKDNSGRTPLDYPGFDENKAILRAAGGKSGSELR